MQYELHLDSILTRFWEVDDYHKPLANFSIEEQLSKQHFIDNVMTLPTGRIQVRLPSWKFFRYSLSSSIYVLTIYG